MPEPAGLLAVFNAVGDALRAIPAPTQYWAAIISAVAWPGVVLFVTVRYRGSISRILTILIDRLGRDEISIGGVKLTPKTSLIPLDSRDAGSATEPYSPDDVSLIETILEYVADEANFTAMEAWMKHNMPPGTLPPDLLTAPGYATKRLELVRALGIGDAHEGN